MWTSILESTVRGGRTRSHSHHWRGSYELWNLHSVLHKACHSDTRQTRESLNARMHNFMGVAGKPRVPSKPVPALCLNEGSFADLKISGIGRHQRWYSLSCWIESKHRRWQYERGSTCWSDSHRQAATSRGALARQSYISVNAPQ